MLNIKSCTVPSVPLRLASRVQLLLPREEVVECIIFDSCNIQQVGHKVQEIDALADVRLEICDLAGARTVGLPVLPPVNVMENLHRLVHECEYVHPNVLNSVLTGQLSRVDSEGLNLKSTLAC